MELNAEPGSFGYHRVRMVLDLLQIDTSLEPSSGDVVLRREGHEPLVGDEAICRALLAERSPMVLGVAEDVREQVDRWLRWEADALAPIVSALPEPTARAAIDGLLETLEAGQEESETFFLCAACVTLADLFVASRLAEHRRLGLALGRFPRTERWMRGMTLLDCWPAEAWR